MVLPSIAHINRWDICQQSCFLFSVPLPFTSNSSVCVVTKMSSSSQADPILVSYHDSIVRRSNLRTLDNTNWLDDNIITFAFEHLQYESEFAECHHLVQFVTPPVVQLLKMTDDSFAEQLLQSIDFLGKQYLVLPINDNIQRTAMGGSHWSLLILSISGSVLERLAIASFGL